MAVPDADWPSDAVQQGVVLADFDVSPGGGAWGDRRQEIVFIGAGMDRGAIEEQLDSALLSEAGAVRCLCSVRCEMGECPLCVNLPMAVQV